MYIDDLRGLIRAIARRSAFLLVVLVLYFLLPWFTPRLMTQVSLSAEPSTWFKVPIKNIKSESGAERLRRVSMHAGEVSGAVLNLSGTLSSL